MSGIQLALLGAGGGPPPTVSISPPSIYDFRLGSGGITSSAATASASGGAGGYSYAWTYVSDDSYTINSPTSATTTFSTTLIGGQTKSGTYRCTVTDAASATGYADIVVELEAL